jgi:PepSY-associated TM region
LRHHGIEQATGRGARPHQDADSHGLTVLNRADTPQRDYEIRARGSNSARSRASFIQRRSWTRELASLDSLGGIRRLFTGEMLKRSAIFVHRWLGVALCLVFLLWFPSGIGMMYWDFPSVSADDRLERGPALNAADIRLSPLDAYATLEQSETPRHVCLNTFDGRPVYRFGTGRGETLVYADTGARQVDVSQELMQRVASAWTRQPASTATSETMDEADQWTVQGSFRSVRPLRKYSWPTGEQVYVSQVSGDIVQYTTTASRIGAYLGPIPHWLYFTPLRKHQRQWSAVVIWASGIGTVAALLGIVIGISTFSPSKRYRHAGAATRIPYRGYKRWHAVIGLIFGLGAVTWAFSGMLSMDPFPLTTSSAPAEGQGREGGGVPQALRDRLSIHAFAARHPREALSSLAGLDVKELELASVAGEAVYLATLGGGDTRIVTLNGHAHTQFDRRRIAEIVRNAAAPARLAELRELTQYDRYYLDRRRKRPLPVLLARLNDADQTRYYIDPRTARIVGHYSSSNWVSRWLYHGLHSLDLPWLYNYRPAWDIVMITFMIGGTALGVTSLILAWRVVGRTLSGDVRT